MTSRFLSTTLLLLACSRLLGAAEANELEYPRTLTADDGTLTVHHPVIDSWDEFETVEGWIPVEARLTGWDTQWVGAVRARAATQVDLARRLVTLSDQEVLEVRFSNGEAPAEAHNLARRAVRSQPHVIVLDALLHALALDFEVPEQGSAPGELNHQPPRIVVAREPTLLLLIDKQPLAAPISGTGLEFIVNTDWPLFHQPATGNWYVINQGVWQTHSMLATGAWNTAAEVPEDFHRLALGDEWAAIRKALPPRLPDREPTPFIVSLEPTELVQIDGPPRLKPAGEHGLEYVANTDRDLFALQGRWYLLLAGRWFEAGGLGETWRPVDELPAAFAGIPEGHPRAHVRAAVPGTVESMVAIMEATLPRRRAATREQAEALAVGYVGQPQFEPVEGAGLERAVNSPNYVFRHNNLYYLCHDAAWFLSSGPDGPWSMAHTVPDAIYRIPATDPAYFVTFVKPAHGQEANQPTVWFEHNSGYFGEFSTGVTVVRGTGWYYPPWFWYDPMGRPVYWSHPYTYGWHMSGYGPHSARFYHYGAYWGSQTITLDSEPVGFGGSHDPAFQDPRLARRGYDYSTIEQQRNAELGRALNADDDYYADSQGNVFRQQNGEWSRHTGEGWNTMAELERQYGVSGYGSVGEVGAPQQQSQAYKQNPNDIERIRRYHESRRRSYNAYGYVTVYH